MVNYWPKLYSRAAFLQKNFCKDSLECSWDWGDSFNTKESTRTNTIFLNFIVNETSKNKWWLGVSEWTTKLINHTASAYHWQYLNSMTEKV